MSGGARRREAAFRYTADAPRLSQFERRALVSARFGLRGFLRYPFHLVEDGAVPASPERIAEARRRLGEVEQELEAAGVDPRWGWAKLQAWIERGSRRC